MWVPASPQVPLVPQVGRGGPLQAGGRNDDKLVDVAVRPSPFELVVKLCEEMYWTLTSLVFRDGKIWVWLLYISIRTVILEFPRVGNGSNTNSDAVNRLYGYARHSSTQIP